MHIGIIGAGSIGLLFASYISSLYSVNIYCRKKEQANEINHNGIILKKGSIQIKTIVHAQTIAEWKGSEDLTIIAVKQYQLEPILEKINSLHNSPENLLFLQNGMAHIRQLESIKAKNIFVGSVEHGALKIAPYIVSHNGEGVTNIALYRGDTAFMDQLCVSAPPDFSFILKQDYYQMLLHKLVINACINPLTAILYVNNGELIANEHYFTALKCLFSEIAFILDLEKPDEYLQKIIAVCQKTASNRSSMLKDIEAMRQTEIDAIIGFLLEEADKKGKKAPQLTSLYHLLKGKEYSRGAFV